MSVWGFVVLCHSQNFITLNKCSSTSEISQNFIQEIEDISWNFKTQFTHVYRHPGAQSNNKSVNFGKTDYIMQSQILEKVASNEPWKTFKKVQQKSIKNIELSIIFGGFRGLNNISYQMIEATFQQSFSLSFHFCFGHQTPGGLET